MATNGLITVNLGDRITVRNDVLVVTGDVLSVDWYGEQDGWFIEMVNSIYNGRSIGYSYWKQGCDGGNITAINGVDLQY